MITIPPRQGFGGQVSTGAPADFTGLNAFTAAAIRPAFYRPDLTPEQVAENDRIHLR